MVVDLNKQKVKVKLKYLIPEDKQKLIPNFDTYGELENEITVQELIDKTGMSLQEYRKKEPLIQKSTQLSLPFNYNHNQKNNSVSHFDRVFNQTNVAIFTI